MSSESILLLDACCAINLLASGVAESILRALPHDPAVAPLVSEREVLYVHPEHEEAARSGGGRPKEPPEIVTLAPFVEQGLIQVLRLEGEEEHATYVNLALELDDGEAMTGALAIHRKAMIATDDKKAIRLLEQTLSSERILRTSQLVKTWADGDASREEVRRALEHIENRASFVPPRSDPLTEWWEAMLGRR